MLEDAVKQFCSDESGDAIPLAVRLANERTKVLAAVVFEQMERDMINRRAGKIAEEMMAARHGIDWNK